MYVIGLSQYAYNLPQINQFLTVCLHKQFACTLFILFCVTAQPDCFLRLNVYIFFAWHVNFSCRPIYDFLFSPQKENAASNVRCDCCCCSFRMQKKNRYEFARCTHFCTCTNSHTKSFVRYTRLHHSQATKIHELHCISNAYLHKITHTHSCPCHCSRTIWTRSLKCSAALHSTFSVWVNYCRWMSTIYSKLIILWTLNPNTFIDISSSILSRHRDQKKSKFLCFRL